jgi:hypothetical protein
MRTMEQAFKKQWGALGMSASDANIVVARVGMSRPNADMKQ